MGAGRAAAGRDVEVEALRQAVARAAGTGSPQVVEVHGEPGIGKTALLDELAVLALERSFEVVSGRAGEYERGVPFGIVAEALGGLKPDDTTQALLDSLTPEGAPGEAGQAGVAHRYRLHRAVRRTLGRRARPSGLVVLLDDVHWADVASLELLESLLLDLPEAPLVVAVAYRAHQVPAGLPAALGRTRAEVTRLAPAPLVERDVAVLLPDVPARRRELLTRVSGGNPLYLDALARLDERALAALDREHTDPEDLPRRLGALLTGELRDLAPDRLRVAHAAAVAGDTAEVGLLVAVAGLPEDEVFAAVDELTELGVLRPSGGRFRFRHPLVRAAAYQSAGAAWRIGAHRRAEEHLRACGGPLALRAHHTSRAARRDDVAVGTLVDAAVVAVDSAPASAAGWLRTALELLPEGDGRSAGLRVLLARAVGLAERLPESRRILHGVLDSAVPDRREAVRFSAVADRLLGRFDESRALLEAELAAGGTGGGRGPLLVELAATEVLRGDTASCAALAREAVVDGRERGDRGQEAAASMLVGLTSLQDGDAGAARTWAASAVRLVDGLPDTALRDHLHVLPPLGWLELRLGAREDAERHLRRGEEVALATGRAHVRPYLRVVVADLAASRGELAVAVETAEEAHEAAEALGSPELAAMAVAARIEPVLWRRGPTAALDLAEEGRPRSGWWAREMDAAVAVALVRAGELRRAGELAGRHAGAGGTRARGLASVRWCGVLAVCQAGGGAWNEALGLAEHAVRVADELGIAFQRGEAALARAGVLAACGRLAESVDEAGVAVERFGEAEAPLQVALGHERAASSLAAAGDFEAARAAFGRAKSGFSACGALWLLGRVRAGESRLGARAPRPRRPEAVGTVEALSGREREVARLVGEGLTNREIAERLSLSAKTVEAHLARVFTKLGVRSRVGVVQRLSGRG
ncbi:MULTISPECIES: LuxR family transcriptional regulator [Actinosynnema]|uniref:ATP-binding protein n=1 Tax=Actinosynnema TaxID=40566 RepID=UPI0020A5F551|nr:LuxR family transcriptional regulator [Actinosynnema pretiosum]MCP2097037.1 regulatory protein, luxR family [Actinosynnema pretiosum]